METLLIENSNNTKAYYINLEERLDRKENIEKELSKLNINYERFNAVKHTIGALGCTISHMKALEKRIERRYRKYNYSRR
jgi:GR25 family glycosyltransferase involved in LPS biosynthesis